MAEKEWKRIEAKDLQRKSDAQETEDQDLFPLAEGYTTAVPRPNAYIPKDGSLPLPRPYGALAPFKPTQPGSMMRHFRKPEPKPIDIWNYFYILINFIFIFYLNISHLYKMVLRGGKNTGGDYKI